MKKVNYEALCENCAYVFSYLYENNGDEVEVLECHLRPYMRSGEVKFPVITDQRSWCGEHHDFWMEAGE